MGNSYSKGLFCSPKTGRGNFLSFRARISGRQTTRYEPELFYGSSIKTPHTRPSSKQNVKSLENVSKKAEDLRKCLSILWTMQYSWCQSTEGIFSEKVLSLWNRIWNWFFAESLKCSAFPITNWKWVIREQQKNIQNLERIYGVSFWEAILVRCKKYFNATNFLLGYIFRKGERLQFSFLVS